MSLNRVAPSRWFEYSFFFRPGIDHVESAGGIEIIGKAYAYIFEELTGTGTARVVSSAPASQPALGTTQVLIGVLPIGVPGVAEESQANNHGFEAALEKLGDENKVAKRLAHLVPSYATMPVFI